jgi:isoleucyl-tRNA synthetase
MSKSLGNITAPQDVVSRNGADILRLWVVASNYSEDLQIGPEIIKGQVEAYRRFRNTLRYLLGALAGFAETERVEPKAMPELERFVLHRLWRLDGIVRASVAGFDFHTMFVELHQFCAVDLSAFYFDIRKDALYCDPADAPRRRACRTVLDHAFACLTAWLAPILCFTTEEAWLCRAVESGAKAEESVHLRLFPAVPGAWRDDALAAKWESIRIVRRAVTGAIEIDRAAKKLGASLQAHPLVYADNSTLAEDLLPREQWSEVFITSDCSFSYDSVPATAHQSPENPRLAVEVKPAQGAKCERCWRVLPEVGKPPAKQGLCLRCTEVVQR